MPYVSPIPNELYVLPTSSVSDALQIARQRRFVPAVISVITNLDGQVYTVDEANKKDLLPEADLAGSYNEQLVRFALDRRIKLESQERHVLGGFVAVTLQPPPEVPKRLYIPQLIEATETDINNLSNTQLPRGGQVFWREHTEIIDELKLDTSRRGRMRRALALFALTAYHENTV